MELKSCCFIGHREVLCEEKVRVRLKKKVLELLRQGVTEFYFGSNGKFDAIALKAVSELKNEYPGVNRVFVRATYEQLSDYYEEYLLRLYDRTFMPLGVINAGNASYVKRNYEMINACDVCVFYYNESYLPPRIKRSSRDLFDYQPKSGTKIAYEYAVKKQKIIYNVFLDE